jgi:2-amino-4-hydroxy-6-hydroxymethyldihydropteridine diphosphokinase
MSAMQRAYVGIGGNLGDPMSQVAFAFERLAQLPDSVLFARSRLYRSPAWGPIAQPDFINAVAALDTALPPSVLMQGLLGIEHDAGRERALRWGPRLLDLDLLLYGDLCIDSDTLQVPHPRLRERAFALVPLAEIAPTLAIPGLGRIADLLDLVDHSTVQALG